MPLKHPLEPIAISSKDIGYRIMTLRKAKGLTQTQLAEQIGITQHVLSNYEIGRCAITVEMLVRFSLALECSTDQLIGLNHPINLPALSIKLMHRLKQIETLPTDRQKKVLQNLENILEMAAPETAEETKMGT
jgi:transcriptional regulator with XRE-family HTH domain